MLLLEINWRVDSSIIIWHGVPGPESEVVKWILCLSYFQERLRIISRNNVESAFFFFIICRFLFRFLVFRCFSTREEES